MSLGRPNFVGLRGSPAHDQSDFKRRCAASRRHVDWLRANPLPALILLDLMMPEIDGFEFLVQMREDKDLLEVPVVVLTAKTLSEDECVFLAERTILVLSKSAQPIGTLGHALAAIALRGAAAMERAVG